MSKYDCELNLEDRNSLSVLVAKVKPNSIVLEFGPANGRMTKYMKEQLNCKVYAVEIDEDAAKDAEQYTEKIIVDSIENYRWQEEFKDLQFDYIIFADVLEHLYYPERVLKSVKEFLKEDGSILVSIPNIAHNSIIINLLKNEFNYNPTGLLDDTHIRFFTKKTFDQLIERSGYFTSYETAIFINPQNTEFGNSYSEVIPEMSEYLQNLPCGEIYQFIYEMKKNKTTTISDFSDEYKVYNKNFIQLFIGDKNGISEENSIRFSVEENDEVQRFEFDLNGRDGMKSLRLDPLNDSCVVEIEKLALIQKDGVEIDLVPYILANVCSHHGKAYFFEHFDPQIYFAGMEEGCFEDSVRLVFEARYAHISKDAVHVCANQIAKDRDHRVGVLNDELVSIYTSKSYKMTRPLRSLTRSLRKIFR
jgi:2-polyprenyl-3-methyl-5-hydroxy-6-metoxy-1,4-benzoquinol methylase